MCAVTRLVQRGLMGVRAVIYLYVFFLSRTHTISFLALLVSFSLFICFITLLSTFTNDVWSQKTGFAADMNNILRSPGSSLQPSRSSPETARFEITCQHR